MLEQRESNVRQGALKNASSENCPYNKEDLNRYYRANQEIASTRHRMEDVNRELEQLEHSDAVELFQKQIALLQKRLVSNPGFFQQVFIDEGKCDCLGVPAGGAERRFHQNVLESPAQRG